MAAGKESVSFFFPAYFDEKSIPLLVKEANAALEKTGRAFEIVIVDDGSPDRTGEVADRLAKEMPHVRAVHHKKNRGYAGALATGFSEAKNELVGYTDGDGQYSIADLPAFLDEIENADIVTGYRANRAEGFTRKLFHSGYKMVLAIVLGMHFKDPDCGFKLMRRKAIPKIRPLSKSSFFVAEMLYRAKKSGFAVKEIPVRHLERRFGSSKCFKPGEIFAMGRDVISMRFGKSN
jgi:glycosyltransferase involved in cell wall biosynthesis